MGWFFSIVLNWSRTIRFLYLILIGYWGVDYFRKGMFLGGAVFCSLDIFEGLRIEGYLLRVFEEGFE